MKRESIAPYERVILVTGDRKWSKLEYVAEWIDRTFRWYEHPVLVHGYADGLDTVAGVAAQLLGYRVVRCPAHWRHNERRCVEVWGPCEDDCRECEGRAAGAIRNHAMLDTYHPVIVVGFHENIQESKGTKEMLNYAQKKYVETELHDGSGKVARNPKL